MSSIGRKLTTRHRADRISKRHEWSMTEATTVLVVEDEVSIRRILGMALAQSGYDVIEAASGAEGITLCFSKSPRVVLLDLGLPDMDGVEVTRRIRESSDVP